MSVISFQNIWSNLWTVRLASCVRSLTPRAVRETSRAGILTMSCAICFSVSVSQVSMRTESRETLVQKAFSNGNPTRSHTALT